MSKTYSEKLLSPKWQKKRLEIMQRDNFCCLLCGDSESTLNVHHKNYVYGNEPWEYPDSNFQTLCHKCHKLQHEPKPMFWDEYRTIVDTTELIEFLRLKLKDMPSDTQEEFDECRKVIKEILRLTIQRRKAVQTYERKEAEL